MSSQTSFVAVEERSDVDRGAAGEVELRRIPVALLKDWHGTDRRLDMRTMMMAAAPSPAAGRTHRAMGFSPLAPMAMDMGGSTFAYAPRDDLSPAAVDPLTALIVLQRADGSWSANEAFATVSGLELDALRGAADESGLSDQESEAAMATLAALHILRRDYADRSDEWTLPAGKAERWLADKGVQAPYGHASLDTWIAEVIARI